MVYQKSGKRLLLFEFAKCNAKRTLDMVTKLLPTQEMVVDNRISHCWHRTTLSKYGSGRINTFTIPTQKHMLYTKIWKSVWEWHGDHGANSRQDAIVSSGQKIVTLPHFVYNVTFCYISYIQLKHGKENQRGTADNSLTQFLKIMSSTTVLSEPIVQRKDHGNISSYTKCCKIYT